MVVDSKNPTKAARIDGKIISRAFSKEVRDIESFMVLTQECLEKCFRRLAFMPQTAVGRHGAAPLLCNAFVRLIVEGVPFWAPQKPFGNPATNAQFALPLRYTNPRFGVENRPMSG